ncbi:uncharacterized protein LOC111830689 [Capsella rubella]|uniref:uncharacterized protein LOC111830689 n=1 Tax=Capsella rubella TaxID=81985 RepID=UPI000CD59F00|nr:uncharacterized protein LOC111830689 [Capsella rubella]
MSENVSIYFKCEDYMYSIMFHTQVRDITLLMLKARINKKLGYVESRVRMDLSYYPLVVGVAEKCELIDDEDVNVFLLSVDHEKRKCILYVDVTIVSEQHEQVLNDDDKAVRVDQSSVNQQ